MYPRGIYYTAHRLQDARVADKTALPHPGSIESQSPSEEARMYVRLAGVFVVFALVGATLLAFV